MTASTLEVLLATFDRHIDSHAAAAQQLASSGVAGPSSLGLKRNELRNLIAPSGSQDGASGPSTPLKLSPLERAISYEVENRRQALQRKQKELDFWDAYENELADKPMKIPTSSSALKKQIEEKQDRLRELEGENRLRIETTRALDSSAVIQKVLSTTSPANPRRKGAQVEGTGEEDRKEYASTRKLLEERDDHALEFLKIFNETRAIKQERFEIKARIREERLETLKLLESIKTIKADIRARQLHPSGSASQDPDVSQNAAAQKVQQMQREINEARSKKELVKGILRGLILESGRDWTKSQSTRALMLSLDDEDDASDDALSEDEEEGEEEDGDEDDDEGIEALEEDEG